MRRRLGQAHGAAGGAVHELEAGDLGDEGRQKLQSGRLSEWLVIEQIIIQQLPVRSRLH